MSNVLIISFSLLLSFLVYPLQGACSWSSTFIMYSTPVSNLITSQYSLNHHLYADNTQLSSLVSFYVAYFVSSDVLCVAFNFSIHLLSLFLRLFLYILYTVYYSSVQLTKLYVCSIKFSSVHLNYY